MIVKSNEANNFANETEGTFATPEIWNKVSEDYKIEIDKSEFQLAEELVKIFVKSGINPPAKIIELGCGSGHLSACLAMKGYNVTLLDFSEGALSKAKETFEHYGLDGQFVKGDIFELSNINEEYDLAWNSGVMEHFSSNNLEKIYCAIMNITKNKFVFLVPNPSCISYLMMRYNLQGNRKWEYGMEYLRTNYLEIAKKAGFIGRVVGYAASAISKWHFYSTFSDSENSELYSKMLEERLLPENESYLIAYELMLNEDDSQIEIEEIVDEENKERIFELSAINYSMEKLNLQQENEIKGYKERLETLAQEKANDILSFEKESQILKEKNVNLKNEKVRLEEDNISLEKDNIGLKEENISLNKENAELEEENISLKKEKLELEEENKNLLEGVKFNQEEKEKLEKSNLELVSILGPRIKSETLKIQKYMAAPGFAKMVRIHAWMGTFKRANFKTKFKMIVKISLRCFGIKKNFYTVNERMDIKIQDCISNIENIVNTIKTQDSNIKLDGTSVESQNTEFQRMENEIIVAMEPKISVLLPVYNHVAFIRNAIEGVQCQSYKNWELIIINDGSTDNLLEILKDYISDPRIRIYTQDNQRLPNTLTNLHNLATGQFVTWTSADNIMEPEMLETLSKSLLLKPEASMVFADVAIIDDKGQFLDYGYREMNRDKKNPYIMRLPHDTQALDVECDNYINACFMYRMDAVKALKGQYSADLEGLEDYDFWLRLRAFGEIYHIRNKKPLYRYRVHVNTMSEDLLTNKLAEHQKRSARMLEYSHSKDAYIAKNWHFDFEEKDSELQESLDKINYNYEKKSDKKVSVVAQMTDKIARNSLFVNCKKDTYEINYFTKEGVVENRAEIYKGIDIPVLAKKVRQTNIFGLFWAYPVEFANKPVVGCHVDMRKISIDNTIRFLKANPDKVFSFCAITGGSNRQAEEKILANCKNAIFMGEKDLGLPLHLYASWDMAFIPPMNDVSTYDLYPAIICAWNIGKWILIEKNNLPETVYPFVGSYSFEQALLGIKIIKDISAVESILDQYIYLYSKSGVAKQVVSVLNGIGQDIFVERPDFELIPKDRKFPPQRFECSYELPEKLKKGYVAIMVDTLDRGGLEQVVAMLVKEFITYGIDIQVFCTGKGGLIADTLIKKGIQVKIFNNNRKEIEDYITKNPPILVNTHYTKNMLDIIKKKNIPIVEVIHNMYVFLDDEAWKLERQREKNFKHMIAVSELVKEVYVKKHGSVDESRITVIGNCADNEKMFGAKRAYVRDELGIGQSSTVFLNVSSMDGRKNQLGLLTAFELYYKSVNTDCYLILVGNKLSEFYDEAVNNYIEELDSKQHVIKIDYYKDIADLYNAADIFVMPSYFEGWSIAATEALYSGLPIIHSKCGSAIELIKNGENGLLIGNPSGDISTCDVKKLNECMGSRAPENTTEMVNAMSQISMELTEWKEKRGMISAKALQEFSCEKMIQEYLCCFNECLNN